MDEMAGSLCDSPAQCVLLGSLLGGAAGAAVGELDDGEVQYVLLRVEGGRDQESKVCPCLPGVCLPAACCRRRATEENWHTPALAPAHPSEARPR